MTSRHHARMAKQALALFFIFILIVQPVVVAQDSADNEGEAEEEAEEEDLTPEVFREISDPGPDDLGRCPTCTTTEFDLLDTSERASFLLSNYHEEYADHFFSDAEHVGVNEQAERSYFSRDGNIEQSAESAERFLQLRYDQRYSISIDPVPTGLRYNAQDDTFRSGPARLFLDQLAQPARVIRIIAVQGGFRFVTRDEDAQEGEEETVDFVSETDSTITFDEENGLFEASGPDEQVQARFTAGDADSRITIDDEGTMTVHGDARGFYRIDGEMVEFQNRQGALRIWSDGRVRADDAEINTRTMYLDGRFYREGDNVVSYSFNRAGQAGMVHSVVVDKATAMGSVSQGQVRREGCEGIPTIEPSGGCGGVVTHLQQRYERSAYGNAERTDTGTGDDAETPQPPISAQEARERARQLRVERPDIGENGEVWIAGTHGGEVSVYARGRVGVQSFTIQGGNVQHIDMGRPRFTGYGGRSAFDYSATGDRDRFQVMGQGEYDDRQIHLDAEQDGTFVQRLMNYDDRTETYEVDCDDCEDGERAATLMKRLMIVRERNVRVRGTGEREEIAIGEQYDEDVLTERLQWQGGMRLEYVQRGDALRTVVPTANLQQIASYTRAEGATIAFDRDFFVRTGSGEEWFGISASGIGSYESTAAGDGFSPRSVTTDLTVRSTIGDIVVPTSEAELEGVRQFLSALGAREWAQEERYGRGYAQLRNVGGITDERVIAALTQETGIDLDYLQRDDAVGEEYTDRIVRALRFAAAGRTRTTFSETPESINDLRGNAQHYQRQQQAMQGQIAFLQAQRLIAEQEGQDTTQIDRSIRRLRGRASQLEHAREAVEQQVEGIEAAQQRADEQRRAATAYGDDINEDDQRRLLEADQIRQQQEGARHRIQGILNHIETLTRLYIQGEGTPGIMGRLFDFQDPDAGLFSTQSDYIARHAPDARRRIAELQQEMGQLSEQIRLSDQRLAALGHESDSQVMRVRVLMAGGRHDLAGEAMAEQTVVIDPATGRLTGGAPIIDDPQTQTALQMMSRMDQGDTRGIRYDLESGRVYTSQRVAFLSTAGGGTETVTAMDLGDLTPEQQGRLQTWGEQVSEEYVSDPAIVQMLSARLREETERHLVEDYNRATRTDAEVRRRVGDEQSGREGFFYNWGHWLPCQTGMCWGEVDDANEGAAGRATRDRRVAAASVLTIFRHGRCGEDGSRQCSMSDIRAMDASVARRQLAEITRRAQASEEEVRIVGGLEYIGTASAESQETFDERFRNRFDSARRTAGFHMAEQAESGFFISDSRVRELQAQALLDEADQISAIHHSPSDQRHVYEQIAREYGETQAAIAAREQIRQIREDETLNFAGINTGWEWGIDSRTAGVFATEMLGDPTNLIPVGLVARGAARGVQLTTAALRATEYAVQVSRAARAAVELNQARRALQVAERAIQAARTAERAAEIERATVRVTELNAHIAQLEQQVARFTTAQRVGGVVLRTTRVPGEAARAILRPAADAYEWLGSANARSRVLYGSAQRREMTALARTAAASERAAVETERSALAAERIAEAARRAPSIGQGQYRSAVTGAQEATLRAQELRRTADVARRTAGLDEEALTLQRRIVEAERIAERYRGVAGTVRRAWGASERAWTWGFRERQASAVARAEFIAAADAFNMFRRAPGAELAGLADDVIQAERAYEQALHAHQVADPLHRAIEWAFAPERLGAPEDFLLRNAQRLERRRAVRHILFGAVDEAGLADDASRQILDTLGTRLDDLEEMASGLPTNLDIRVLSDGRVSYNENVFRALQGSDPELAEGVRGVVGELNELIGNSGLADEAAVMAARLDAPVTTQSVAAAVTDDIADAVRELPPEANPRISCQGAVAGYRCTVEVDTAGLAPERTAQRQAEDLALMRANEGLRELEEVGGEPFVQSVREGIVSSSREDEIIEEAAQIATTADAGEEVIDALRAGEIGSDRPVSRLLGEQLPISDRPPLSGQVAWNDDAGAIARAVQDEIQDSLARSDADRLAALRNLLDDERIVARFRETGADDVLQHLRVRADEAIGGRTSISSSMGEEIGDLSVTSRRTTTSSQPISRQFVSDEELARIRASVQQEMPPGTLPEQIDLEVDTIVRRMEREGVSEFQPPRIEPEARRVEPEAPPARVEPELAPEPAPEVVAPAPRPRPAPEAPVDELLAARQRLDEIDDTINRLEEIVRHEDTPVAQRISAQRKLDELSSARIEQERIVRGFEMGPAPAPEPALAPGARPEPIPAPAQRPREAVLADLERMDSNLAVAQREAEIAQRESAAAERGLAEAAGAPQEELRAIEQRAGSARLRQEQAERSLAAREQEFIRTVSQAPDDVVQEFRAAHEAEEGVVAAPAETLPTRASQRADELEGVADGARQELTTIDDNLDAVVRQKIDAEQRLRARIARGKRIGPDDEDLQALSHAIEDERRLDEARAAMRQRVTQLEESRVMAEQQDVVAITRRLLAQDPNIPRRMHEDYQEFLGTLSQEDRARARRITCQIASPITCDDGDLGDDLERVFRPAEEAGIQSTFTPDEMDAVVSHANDLPEHRPPSDLARDVAIADTRIPAAADEEQRRMLSLAFDDTVLREEGQLLPESRIREGLPRVPASLPDGRFRPVEISAQNFPDLDERLLGWMEENGYASIVGRQEPTEKTQWVGHMLDNLEEVANQQRRESGLAERPELLRQLGLGELLFLRREDGTGVVWRLDMSDPVIDDFLRAQEFLVSDTGTRQIASRTYEMVGERLEQTTGIRRRALAGRRVGLPDGRTVVETPAVDFTDLGKAHRDIEILLEEGFARFEGSDEAVLDLLSAVEAGERRFAGARMEPVLSRLERPAQRIIDEYNLIGDDAAAIRRIDTMREEMLLEEEIIDGLSPSRRNNPEFIRDLRQTMKDQEAATSIRRMLLADTQLSLERFAYANGLSRSDIARVERALREDGAIAAALGMSDSGVGIRIADDGVIELVRFDEEFFGSGIFLPIRGQEGLSAYRRPYEFKASIGLENPDVVFAGGNNFIFGYTLNDEVVDAVRDIAQERGLERITEEEALRLYIDEFAHPVSDAIDDVFAGPRREETLDLIRSAVHPQSGVDADAYARAFQNGVLSNAERETLEDTVRQMVRNDGRLVVSPEVVALGPDGRPVLRSYHTQREVLGFYERSPAVQRVMADEMLRMKRERLRAMQPSPEEAVSLLGPKQTIPPLGRRRAAQRIAAEETPVRPAEQAPAHLELSTAQRAVVDDARRTTEMTMPPANLDNQIRQFERIEVSASRPSRFEPLEVSADDLVREVSVRHEAIGLSDAPVDIEIVRQPTISEDGQFVIRQDSRPVAYGRIARRGESAARDNTLGALRDMAQLQAHGGQHAPRPLFIAYFDDAQGTPHLLTIQSAAPGETAEDILRRVVTSSGTEREAAMQRAREAMRDIGAALGDSHSRSLQEVSDDALDLLDEDINFMTQAMGETELTQKARTRGDILRTAQRYQVTTHTDFRLPNVLHSEEAGGIIIDFEKARVAGHPSDDLATFMEDIVTASRTDRLGGEFTQTEIDELLAEFLAGYRRNSPVGMDEIEEGLGFYRARRVFRAPDPNIEQRLAHILSDEGANDVRRIIDRSYEIEREAAMAEGIPAWRPPPPAAPHVVALRDEMRNVGRMDDASLARLDDVLDDIEPQIRGNTIITCPGCAVTYTGDNPEGVQIARTLRDTIHRIEADDPAALRMPSTGTADDLAEALAIEEAAREQGIAVRRTIAVGNDARDAARQPSRIGDSVLAEARVERDSIIIERPLVEAPAAPAVQTAEEYAQPIIDPTDIAPRDVRTAQNPLEEDPSFGGFSYQPSVGQAIERVLQSPGITTSDAVAVINHPRDYVLSFRHGTSSAALGGIASEGRLMTYGDLRASGRVPFSGELSFGIRPGDINWEYISGVPFYAGGVDISTYARGMTRGWTPQIGEQQLEATAQGLEFVLQAKADGVRRVGYMAIDDVIAVSRERLSIAQQRIDTWSRLNPFEQQMISDPFPIVISAEVPDLTTVAIVAAQRGGVPIQGIATERLARGSINLDETPFVVFVPRERMHQVQQYLEMRMDRPVRVQSIGSLEAFDEITYAFSPEGMTQVAMGNRYNFRKNPEWLARFREDGASYLRGEPPRPVRERMAVEAAEREVLEEELAALTPQGVQDELLSAHDEILRAQRQLGRAQEDAAAARDRLRRWRETPEGKQQMRQELPVPLRDLLDAESRVDAAQAELRTARDMLGRARERAAHVGLDADMELALVDTRREQRIADLENRLRRARQERDRERDRLREALRRVPAGIDIRGRLPVGFEVGPELPDFQKADRTVASVERQLQTEQDLLQASQAQKAGLQAQRAARAPNPQEARGLLGRLFDKVRGVCRIGSYECDVDVLPDTDLDDVGRALGRTDVMADNLDVVVAAELGEALGPTPPTGSLEEISEALETASEISHVEPLPTTDPGPSAMITALLERELPGTSELAGLADAEASQIREAFAARYQEGVIQLSEEELIDITNIPNRFAQPYDTYLRMTHPGAPTARITGVIDAESGAYGVVMRGRIPNIDEDVALKIQRDVRADDTPVYDTAEEAIRATEQELAAGERLHGWTITHEGVEYPIGPRMHGLVDCGGNPCLAMEEIRGAAVKPLYQQERWDEVAQVLTDDVIDQAYQGVRRAWQEGYASDDWQFIVTPESRVVFIDAERIVPRTGRITLKNPEEYRDFLRSVQRRAREAREEGRIAGLPGAERVAEQQRLADIEFASQEVVFRLNRLESAREIGRGVEEAQAEAREALKRLRGLSREDELKLSPRLTPDEEDLVRTWADRFSVGKDEPVLEILQEVGEDTGLARDAIAQDSEIVLIIDEERYAQET